MTLEPEESALSGVVALPPPSGRSEAMAQANFALTAMAIEALARGAQGAADRLFDLAAWCNAPRRKK